MVNKITIAINYYAATNPAGGGFNYGETTMPRWKAFSYLAVFDTALAATCAVAVGWNDVWFGMFLSYNIITTVALLNIGESS